MIGDLLESGVVIKAKPLEQSVWMQIFISSFPFLIIIGIWLYFMRQMQGGGKGGAMSFGKSKARLLSEDQIKINFSDVAGVDEAKEEVGELSANWLNSYVIRVNSKNSVEKFPRVF